MNRPNIGDYISAKAYVRKRRSGKYNDFKTDYEKVAEQVDGVYIGYRTVFEGNTHYITGGEGDDGFYGFIPKKHFEVWLIVNHPRRKPITILPEDLDVRIKQSTY